MVRVLRLSDDTLTTNRGNRYPPDTEQKQKDLGEWFGKNMPQGPAAKLPEYVATLRAANPSITSWGLIGVSSVVSSYQKLF
jgi:hypothetical protein